MKDICVFGFENIGSKEARELKFRQNCLRIPHKLLKNDSSVAFSLLEDGISVPLTLQSIPNSKEISNSPGSLDGSKSGSDILCFCICRA